MRSKEMDSMMPLNMGPMLLEDKNNKDLKENIFVSPRNQLYLCFLSLTDIVHVFQLESCVFLLRRTGILTIALRNPHLAGSQVASFSQISFHLSVTDLNTRNGNM